MQEADKRVRKKEKQMWNFLLLFYSVESWRLHHLMPSQNAKLLQNVIKVPVLLHVVKLLQTLRMPNKNKLPQHRGLVIARQSSPADVVETERGPKKGLIFFEVLILISHIFQSSSYKWTSGWIVVCPRRFHFKSCYTSKYRKYKAQMETSSQLKHFTRMFYMIATQWKDVEEDEIPVGFTTL